jgi:glycosyltransferase involved in cell wall biosynthesis
MKVALIGFKGEFNNAVGAGVGRYAYELYNNLSNILSSNNYLWRVEKYEINPIFNKNRAFTYFIGAYKYLLFDKSKADILHFISPNPAINSTVLRIRKQTKTTIATAHEFGYLNQFSSSEIGREEFAYDLRGILYYKLLQLSIEGTLGADYLICNSTQTKEEAIKIGFDKNKIFVVNLGIDRKFSSARSMKSFNKNYLFVVGYLGNLRKRKNIEFAIKTLNLINNQKIKFEIWGNGPAYTYLKQISQNKNILFKGFAPEKRIVEIYDSFDVFIFPSLYEGFGLPIIEAQARGIPVIIYKYGKIPNEVRKYCFEAEDPEHAAEIIETLKENGYNEKERKKAMRYARSFTWEKTARETLKVYNEVIK